MMYRGKQLVENGKIATAIIPDGYYGDTKKVDIVFEEKSGHVFVVADCGFFRSPLPQMADKKEAVFYLKKPHHSISGWKSIKII